MPARSIEEELAFRRRRQGVFGGSDAPAVFGFINGMDALTIYHQKTRPIERERVQAEMQERNIDLYRGRRNETAAVAEFFAETGYDGRHETRQIHHSSDSPVAVHVDGTIFADEDREPPKDETGVLEAKSPRAQTFSRLIQEGIPRSYIIQVQFNCAVTDRAWGALSVFCDHHDEGPVLPVESVADPELGRIMVERAEAFMREHVEQNVPPDPDEWDLTDEDRSREVLADREGSYREVDAPEFVDGIAGPMVDAYRTQKEASDTYDRLREEAQEWIEEHLETDAVRLPEGHKIRVIRRDGRTYLDKDHLKDHRPIDRDALMRLLLEDPGTHFEDPADVERWIEDHGLALDFERFERQGSPNSHVRVYPND